jgi:hypothetical protein
MKSNNNRKLSFLRFIVLGKTVILLLGLIFMIMLARNWTSYIFVALSLIVTTSILLLIKKKHLILASYSFLSIFIIELFF